WGRKDLAQIPEHHDRHLSSSADPIPGILPRVADQVERDPVLSQESAGRGLVLETELFHLLKQVTLFLRRPVRIDQHVDVFGQGWDRLAGSIKPRRAGQDEVLSERAGAYPA